LHNQTDASPAAPSRTVGAQLRT